MTEKPRKHDLKTLLNQIKLIEFRLDAATYAYEKFCRINPSLNPFQDPEALSFKQKEALQAEEWTNSFDAILSHKPQDILELKYKALALIDFIDSGNDDPRALASIKQDLRDISITTKCENLIEDISSASPIRTFLIVDDSPLDRMLIKRALTKVQDNLEFIELNDGKDVINAIKLTKPSLTLLDVRMPGMDGYDVLKLIRDDEDLKDHPVLMLSSSSETRDVKLALATGANGYFSKPNSITEYSNLAETILEQTAA